MRSLTMVFVALVLLAGCGSDDDSPSAGDNPTEVTECADVDAPGAREPESGDAPSEGLDDSTTYTLVFDTSCGAFTITLDTELAPKTAASLVALANAGYFDDTIFHRVVPGFVIQGGDPTQRGDGGPGYSTVDVPPSDAAYTQGVVAMAKTQVEAPGTSGSQFFVVTGADAGLTPDYAVLGKVTKGMDVVQAIGELGDPASGAGTPLQSVVIEGTKVREL